jgi:hypothetical protein
MVTTTTPAKRPDLHNIHRTGARCRVGSQRRCRSPRRTTTPSCPARRPQGVPVRCQLVGLRSIGESADRRDNRPDGRCRRRSEGRRAIGRAGDDEASCIFVAEAERTRRQLDRGVALYAQCICAFRDWCHCGYRKIKPAHSDGEVRPRWRANL